MLGPLRAALTFLTRLPAGGGRLRDADWRAAPGFFPAVGLLIGAFSACGYLLGAGVSPLVGGCLALLVSLLLTGALHEDGLADTADALGGARPGDRDKLFAILKDSRNGSFGTAALGMSLLLRVALLAALDTGAPAALLLAHVLGRVPPVWLMAQLPYVTPQDSSRSGPLTGSRPREVITATVLAVAACAGGVMFAGLSEGTIGAALLGLCAATAYLGWRFRVRAGGFTGDFLGALEQVSEVIVLLALALAI
jgi:adenosylcobinamide-GDP ribazoletransferase